MRWTKAALKTRASTCGRRSRVVLTPRRWRQVGGGNSADDGGKQARSPGRARRKPLKPLRRECRVNRCDRGDYARVLFLFCTRGCGRYPSARHSLRPLIFRGEGCMHSSGASRAARKRGCVLTSLSATNAKRLRKGAKATKQSTFAPCGPMDC